MLWLLILSGVQWNFIHAMEKNMKRPVGHTLLQPKEIGLNMCSERSSILLNL
jgi:hypothetical protein